MKMGELENLRAEIKCLQREIEELSIDEVTGIAGRRLLDRELTQQFVRSKRFGRDVGVLMIDIDHFKRFNDEYGHAIGDTVLRDVAQAVALQVRESDTVGRYGGEELVVCVDAAKDVEKFAERLRQVVEALPYGVTISIGCAVSRSCDRTAEDTLNRADGALYHAKRAGRNRVGVAL
jgi:diguanylate cyclase (GGDEF)-like protein